MDLQAPADGDVEDEVIEIQGEAETLPLRPANNPQTPSAKAMEEHRTGGHIPFRDWCRFCIKGRGLEDQHRPATEESSIPIVGLDYFFLTQPRSPTGDPESSSGQPTTDEGEQASPPATEDSIDIKLRSELDYEDDAAGNAKLQEARHTGKIIKCLIVRCTSTKAIFAHCIPYKGAGEDQYVANLVVQAVEWLGHTRLILKADNEPSLCTMIEQSLEEIRIKVRGVAQISVEHPPRYDSQSNGGVETGVRLIRGHFRTLKLCLESRIGKIVPIDHALMHWMMEYTALLMAVRYSGKDGKTAWYRARGRNFHCNIFNFAEMVLYKLPAKGPMHDPDGNMGPQWAEGVFLGYDRSSNTYRIHAASGVVSARTVRRRPENERWSADHLAGLTATPWSLHDRVATRVRFRTDAPAGLDESAEPPAAPLRHLRINIDDLDRHGYTEGCVQCTYMRRHRRARPGTTHSHACRARMEEAIAQTTAGKQRLDRHNERLNEAMAKEIQRADALRPPPPTTTPTEFLPTVGARESAPTAQTDRFNLSQPSPAPRTAARRTSTAAASSSRADDAEPTPHPREEENSADGAMEDADGDAMECEDPTPFQNFTDGDDNMLSSLGATTARARNMASSTKAMDMGHQIRAKIPRRNGESLRNNVQTANVMSAQSASGEQARRNGERICIGNKGLTVNEMPGGSVATANNASVMNEMPGGSVDQNESETEQTDREMKESILWKRCLSCLGSLQPDQGDVFSQKLLGSIGYFQAKTVISEIYSPPRVTAEVARSKNEFLTPGLAFDITVNDPDDGQPWDFNVRAKREKAREILRKQRPYLIIGSPMCTAFSSWQYLNEARLGHSEKARKAKRNAIEHMKFAASLYLEQLQAGRYFLHEHPKSASSWSLPFMKELMKIPGVTLTHGDQCQYGAKVVRGPLKGRPVKKPSGFLSNSKCLSHTLSRTCSGTGGACSLGGQHAQCSGIIAKDAAVYPRGLCQAVIKGIVEQLKEDKLVKAGCFGVQVADDEEEIESLCQSALSGYSGKFKDDISGQTLRDELVHEARRVELDFFSKKGVWVKVPYEEARRRTGRPPITVRWVDTNKGDEVNENYRSRLVARQLKAHDHSDTSYFAPAPPLEALRTIISLAMTEIGSHKPILDPKSPKRSQLSFVDIKRAYFNALVDPKDPPTYVRLPSEDGDHQTMCARLQRHMYGTRMAADGWQQEYSTLLIVRLGFQQGGGHANLFYHPVRGIRTSVHGDDFTSQGPCNELDWLEAAIAEHYEITIGPRLGPGDNDAKEGRALNRIVRWCSDHVEYEADPRQAERLVTELGLEGSQSMVTPGVRAAGTELTTDSELSARAATDFRGSAARGNYIGPDRIDAQFASKEICRYMAKPMMSSWKALKRLGRFYVGKPRLVYDYPRQKAEYIEVYVDTDWAGCPRTRKSTSGGCVFLGRHAVKHWSSTQTSIALSSAEAEFGGVIRGSGQGLGYQSMLKDLGLEVPLRVWTDSSAAIGICQRQGLGKVRHLDTQTLWIQQAVRTKKIDLRKIDGNKNPADLLTKHSISEARLNMLVGIFGCRYVGGRAESAPKERKGVSSKFTLADAAKELNSTQPQLEDEETSPSGCSTIGSEVILPHVHWPAGDLDRRHPSCSVPDDANPEDGQEQAVDRADRTLQRGLKIARNIREQMLRFGRVKYMPNALTHCERSPDHSEQALPPNSCTFQVCPVRPRELPSHCRRRSVGRYSLSTP